MMDSAALEHKLQMKSASEVEAHAGRLKEKLDEITGRTERMKHDPEAVLLSDKQNQLATVLAKYGTEINCETMSLERIALGVARIQGEEAIVREDLARLSAHENTKDLKNALEITQRILAEKKQHGGRADD